MKKLLIALCFIIASSPCYGAGSIYQWTDSNGVTNFTDDPETIPKAYRNKAIRRETDGKIKPLPAAPSEPAIKPPPPAPAEPEEQRYGGHVGTWWQEQFRSLRSEVKNLKEGLDAKQAQLVQLRRKRAIYMRARDREAVNAAQARIDADSARLSDLQKQLDALERAADEASLPGRWRQ